MSIQKQVEPVRFVELFLKNSVFWILFLIVLLGMAFIQKNLWTLEFTRQLFFGKHNLNYCLSRKLHTISNNYWEEEKALVLMILLSMIIYIRKCLSKNILVLKYWQLDSVFVFPVAPLSWSVILQAGTLTGLLMQGLTCSLLSGPLGGKLSGTAVPQKMKCQLGNHLLQSEGGEKGEKSPDRKSRRGYAISLLYSLSTRLLTLGFRPLHWKILK